MQTPKKPSFLVAVGVDTTKNEPFEPSKVWPACLPSPRAEEPVPTSHVPSKKITVSAIHKLFPLDLTQVELCFSHAARFAALRTHGQPGVKKKQNKKCYNVEPMQVAACEEVPTDSLLPYG